MIEKFNQEKNEEDIKIENLLNLVRNKSISGNDFRRAYLKSLGFEDDNSNEDIEELSSLLAKYQSEGFPLNWMANIMVFLEKKDLFEDEYIKDVDDLSVSDKEKEILKSIVLNKRNGVLHFIMPKDERLLAEINIDFSDHLLDQYKLLEELSGLIKLFKGLKKLEIQFIN